MATPRKAPSPKSRPIASCSDRLIATVEAEDARERADEGDDAPPARDVAAEVGAESGDGARQRDEAHRLAEDRAGAIAVDGDRRLGDLLEAAHAGIVLVPGGGQVGGAS